MSDVAFQLIIFFLVTSIFLVKEGLVVTLPDRNSPAKIVSRGSIIEIEIKPAGELFLDSKPVQPETLSVKISELRIKKPESVLMIKVAASAPYEKAVEVIDALKSAGESGFSIRSI
jgi:biopolymer transport protein ExbD